MKHIFIFVAVICLPHVSGEDACPCVTGSNCPEDCTLVNIAPQATSNLTSRDNRNYTITGQAAWVTDGVTSGPCASVSSLYPAWKAEFGQNRTVSRIRIFWEGPQKDVSVSVGGRVCHTESSSYTWMSEYTLICEIPVTGHNLLIRRQPTGQSLNLSLCEVEIYALPSTSSFVSTTSLRSTTSSTTSGTSTTSAVSEKNNTVASTDTFTQTKTTPIDLTSTEPKTSSTGTVTVSDTASTEVTTLLTTAPVTTSLPKISKEIRKPATTAPAPTTTAITPTKIPTLITTAVVTTTSPITSAGIPTPGCRTTCTCACDYAALTTAAVLLFVAVVVICATTVTITLVRKRQGTTRINSEKSQPCYSEIMLKDLEGDHIYGSLCHEKNRSGKGST